MRELRFRAWDNEGKKMYDVEEMSWDEDGSIHGLVKEDGEDRHGRIYLGERTLVDKGNINNPEGYIDDFTLLQFTGLKDKRGKEIYEGDIVKVDCRHPQTEKDYTLMGKVHYRGCSFMVECFDKVSNFYATEKCEVVGNIYQDKELIK